MTKVFIDCDPILHILSQLLLMSLRGQIPSFTLDLLFNCPFPHACSVTCAVHKLQHYIGGICSFRANLIEKSHPWSAEGGGGGVKFSISIHHTFSLLCAEFYWKSLEGRKVSFQDLGKHRLFIKPGKAGLTFRIQYHQT